MKRKLLSLLLAVSMMTTALTGCNAGNSATKSKEEISDWTKAYDEYFNENRLMRDNSKHITSLNYNGVNVDMSTAISGENYLMSFDLEIAKMNVYNIDNTLYGNIVTEGESAWVYATTDSNIDFGSFVEMDIPTVEENINSWAYKEEVTKNGIIYDTLTVTTDSEEGESNNMLCYINRETQKIDKYIKYKDGESTEFVVEDIESIELPATAASVATPATVEEIAAGLSTLLMVAAMAASSSQ